MIGPEEFAMMLVSLCGSKFSLNPMQTLYASKIIGWVLEKLSSVPDISNFIKEYIYIMIICVASALLFYFKKQIIVKLNQYRSCRGFEFKIYNEQDIANLGEIFLKKPQFLLDIHPSDVGAPSAVDVSLFLPSVKTRFKIRNITGTIQQKISVTKSLDNFFNKNNNLVDRRMVEREISYVVIELDVPMQPNQFLLFIRKTLSDIHDNGKYFSLSGHQMVFDRDMKISYIVTCIYKKIPKSTYDPNQKINEYFYKDRDIIFKSALAAIDRNDNWNCILHGPGGTGKSLFSSMLAYVTKRDIVSVDLRFLSKKSVYNVLCGSMHGGTKEAATLTYKNRIHVIEEFDNTIRYLLDREIKEQEDIEYVDGKPFVKPKDPTLLRVSDLLEIFQGVIHRPGLIIVATTNDLDFIKKSLPTLVRFGRLTPYYVGYIDNTVYEQIIDFYFKDRDIERKWRPLPSDHQIPTVQIVNYAKTALGNFDYFLDMMDRCIN